VAAGYSHSLALLASGVVLAWGDNTYGQTSIPNSLLQNIYVGFWWGGYWTPNTAWVPIQAIAAGGNHCLALVNGNVVGWGENGFHQASPPANLFNVIAIAAGYLHSVALCSNGTVVAWGDNSFGQTNLPPGLTNVVAIAAGDFHTLALLKDGKILGWGDDTFGQINVPANEAPAAAIAAGNYDGLALARQVPLLFQRMTGKGMVIQWNVAGTLQSAPTPLGPYTNVPSSAYVYTNTDLSAPAEFFRLRQLN
jgi:alpha-tubulin suppressor-like RCC1 family protein